MVKWMFKQPYLRFTTELTDKLSATPSRKKRARIAERVGADSSMEGWNAFCFTGNQGVASGLVKLSVILVCSRRVQYYLTDGTCSRDFNLRWRSATHQAIYLKALGGASLAQRLPVGRRE